MTTVSADPRWELRKQLYPKDPIRLGGEGLQQKMLSLFRSLQAQISGGPGRTVLLTGLAQGGGPAVIARELAKTVALKLGQRVLLLDATPQASRLSSLNVFPNYSWSKAFRDDKSVADAVYQLGDSSLYVSQIARDLDDIAEVIQSPQSDSCFAALNQVFELCVIDSALDVTASDVVPTGTVLSNCLALAGRVGGTLVVIESEKTRWQYAARLISDLENRGAHVLGTVLSDRRYHIPQFLYGKL